MLNNFRTNITFLAKMLALKSSFKLKSLRLNSFQGVTLTVLLRQGLPYQSLCLANPGKCGVCFVFTAPCFQDIFSLLFVLNTQCFWSEGRRIEGILHEHILGEKTHHVSSSIRN